MASKLTQKDFVAKARDAHGPRYDYSKVEYKNTGTKVEIVCPEHGSFWQNYEDHVRSGAGCPMCNGGVKLSKSVFVAKATKIHGSRYDYSKVKYQNSSTKVEIVCPTHGSFWQRPNSHVHGTSPQGCPTCGVARSAANRTKGVEFFAELGKVRHGNKYDYSRVTGSPTCMETVEIVCPDHGSFWQSFNNHTKGVRPTGCPACASLSTASSQEAALVVELESLGINPILSNRRGVIEANRRLELDIYLPEHKLAIEVNGVYWHSEANGKSRNYHYDKTVALHRQGIKLLHFWDGEVERRRDLVTSMVKQRLGLTKRIGARSLSVEEIDPSDAAKFLNLHHLQGSAGCQFAYGLRAKKSGKLAAVMTFGKPFLSPGYDWELKRFATHQGITVVGGASRLLAAFRKNHRGSIITYADLRYSTGDVYRRLGFKLSHRSPPNFSWARGFDTLIPRYQAQKHKLGKLLGDDFDPNLSAVENMQKAGFSRVFDCGNLVFSLVGD